jgi:hypothetical protein
MLIISQIYFIQKFTHYLLLTFNNFTKLEDYMSDSG